MSTAFSTLLTDIHACTLCSEYLPLGPRPVLQAHPSARILIASQAPGRKVHETGIPFNDASGKRLRDWLGISEAVFYDPRKIAIVPMGFCYPGKGASGDLPPRPECAATWRDALLSRLKNLQLTVVIGSYALAYHLPEAVSLTEAVAAWRNENASVIALPHPSPRNNPWLKRHPWFEEQAVPQLQARVRKALAGR